MMPETATPPTRRRDALAIALGLDALGVAAFVLVIALLAGSEPRDTPDDGFFAEPLPAILVLLAAAAVIAAGVIAAVSLVRRPLRTRAGHWAVRLAIAGALLPAAVGLGGTAVAAVLGVDLPEGWGQPIVPVWMLTSLTSVVLGVRAHEPGRRGALVAPFLLGATVITFAAGEVLVPH